MRKSKVADETEAPKRRKGKRRGKRNPIIAAQAEHVADTVNATQGRTRGDEIVAVAAQGRTLDETLAQLVGWKRTLVEKLVGSIVELQGDIEARATDPLFAAGDAQLVALTSSVSNSDNPTRIFVPKRYVVVAKFPGQTRGLSREIAFEFVHNETSLSAVKLSSPVGLVLSPLSENTVMITPRA